MPRSKSTQQDELGQSISVLFAVSTIALLLITGLVVDGGAHAAGTRRAELAASTAARAAADAGATASISRSSAHGSDAVTAGRRVITASGLDGEVEVRSGSVRVTTSGQIPTFFLGIIGVNQLTVRGDATAVLVTP